MLASQIPTKFPIVWGADAGGSYINPIPTTTATPGRASLTLGFPPVNFQPVAAGGIPMFGADVNGIYEQLSAWAQWQSAGAPISYDGAFSTAIGGYPSGAWLLAASGDNWWVSQVDNNTSDPDTGGPDWQYVSFGQSYAGNPNGYVAGTASSEFSLSGSFLWDTTNKILWLCTTTGTASTAVWAQLANASNSPTFCGTSGGTADAQAVTPPGSMQAFGLGSPISWIAGQTNTGATTLTITGLGTFNIYKSGPSGPVALTGGEIVAGNVLWGRNDGTRIQLVTTALGNAAMMNVTSQAGLVVTATGAFTPGDVLIAGDAFGSAVDGGTPSTASTANTMYNLGLNF